jgi:hypothetical protein
MALSSAPWRLLGLQLLDRLLIISACWVVSYRLTEVTLNRFPGTTALPQALSLASKLTF